MSERALFEGLAVDPAGQPVEATAIAGVAHYVVVDGGFKFHIDAERVDREVLRQMGEQIQANREAISAGAMQMLGHDDLFTKAAIDVSLNSMNAQFDQLIAQGMPENAKAYLGMLGFLITLNYHGEVVEIRNPGLTATEDPD